MIWESVGKELTRSDIDGFALRYGDALPPEVEKLLRRINGGVPGSDLSVPVDDPNDPEAEIKGIYGIGHSLEHLDLEDYLEIISEDSRFEGLWPIGYDPFGGPFVYVVDNQKRGEIRFVPDDQMDLDSPQSYRVAKNMDEFIKLLGLG
jgi:hypothetical protein